MNPRRILILIVVCSAGLVVIDGCKKRDDDSGGVMTTVPATPYEFIIPERFPQNANPNPPGNPMTVEGVKLGRKLFYDERLSADNTMSCASCHNQAFAFTDNENALSEGIDGIEGKRNAMPLFNLAWANNFFWDGRRNSLESQAHDPVVDPVEMHNTWSNAAKAIKNDADYIQLFKAAFGSSTIDSITITKAIAQFERSMVSSNSKLDLFLKGEYTMNAQEKLGKRLFETDRVLDGNGNVIVRGADCFHCHTGVTNLLLTDNRFHNNALDLISKDSGLAAVTNNPSDMGKFKTPSLRNISYTAPYMHDGRFATLRDVIDFYSEGLKNNPNADPLMKNVQFGGVKLEPFEKDALIAYLKMFDDTVFINEEAYSDPNL